MFITVKKILEKAKLNFSFTMDKSNQKIDKSKNIINGDVIINNNIYQSMEERNEIVRKIQIDENKIINIKQIKNIYKLANFAQLSSDEVFKIIIDNNLFDEVINIQEIRHADIIKKNLLFLEKTTSEEKNILIWIYLFKFFAEFPNLLENQEVHIYLDSIRNKFPFPNKKINSEFAYFLNSLGVMHETIVLYKNKVSEISLKMIEANNSLNLGYQSFMSYASVLELSVKWLFKREKIDMPVDLILKKTTTN